MSSFTDDRPEYVVMYGKDFDNPDKCVRTKVHRDNIEAFRASGWQIVEDAEECLSPDELPVISGGKKEKEKEREPLETSPQTLNTEPIDPEPDNETKPESKKESIKKKK